MVRREPWLVPLLCAAVLAGCGPSAAPPPPMRPPDVEVARAEERTITDYEVFYGKTQGEKEVDVRARVSGYLDKILFKDGVEVHENDVLFEIDQRPLQAELERAEANLAQAESHVQRLEYDYRRAQTLANNKSMSREEYDKVFGDLAEGRAAQKAAEAARNSARLNLEYSLVRAPIGGRISRRMVDRGNLVKADDTILTRIVSLDPMYAYFDIDERTFRRVKDFLEQQGYSPDEKKTVQVALGLSDERGGDAGEAAALDDANFPFQGEIDFVDNRIDPDSGSLWVRGTFKNPKPEKGGPRPLTSGLFVRVRLPVSDEHRAVLIPERALATDQGQKFVWVVQKKDEEGKEQYQAVYRQVEFGAQHVGPWKWDEDPAVPPEKHVQQRVIKGGIKAGELVIVSGLQRVRADPSKHYAVVNVLPPKKADAAKKEGE